MVFVLFKPFKVVVAVRSFNFYRSENWPQIIIMVCNNTNCWTYFLRDFVITESSRCDCVGTPTTTRNEMWRIVYNDFVLCVFSHFKIENYVNKRRKNEELKTYCVMMIHTQWSGMLSCYTVNSNQRRHLFRIQTQIQCQQNVGLVCLWISFCFCDVYIRLRDFIHSARELVATFLFRV